MKFIKTWLEGTGVMIGVFGGFVAAATAIMLIVNYLAEQHPVWLLVYIVVLVSVIGGFLWAADKSRYWTI